MDDITPCIRCNQEFFQLFEGKTVRCTVNFRLGREKEYEIRPAERRKRVLVVGGGPGGMEAARVATLRGHEVTLYEKAERLGGNNLVASAPRFKEDTGRITTYLTTQVKKLGIKVELGKEATRKTAEELKPDVVIVAAGAEPFIPDIPGAKMSHVLLAEAVLLNQVRPGGEVLVAGGGLVGCDTALHIAELRDRERRITLIEMLDEVAYNHDPISKMVVKDLLAKNSVQVMTGVKLEAIDGEGGIVIDKAWNRRKVKADTVVLALGYRPRSEVVKAFQGAAEEVYAVGDCVEARKLREAIHEGFVVAFRL